MRFYLFLLILALEGCQVASSSAMFDPYHGNLPALQAGADGPSQ